MAATAYDNFLFVHRFTVVHKNNVTMKLAIVLLVLLPLALAAPDKRFLLNCKLRECSFFQ